MTEKYRFFDPTEDDPRDYSADDFARRYKLILSNGFFYGLGISTNNSMTVTVEEGAAFLEGYDYENTSELDLTHDSADSSQDRIDRIVIRLDRRIEYRDIRAFVKKGSPASTPSPPSLTRDDYIWEISVAQVRILAGKSFIESSEITDERGNYEVCGRVGLAREVNDQITSVDVTEVDSYPSEYGEGVMSFRMSGNETPGLFQEWLNSIGISPSDYGRNMSQLRAHVFTQSNRNDTGVQTITIYDWARAQDYQIYGKFSRAANALDNPLWGTWHEEVLVYDRGSDEQGSWVRYTDGTMECWFEDLEVTQVRVSATGGTLWEYKTFNFPQPFDSIPVVTPLTRREASVQWAGLRASTTSSCEIYIFSTSEDGSGYLGYHAKGRWR
ncbi:hypothetical protein [Alkalicoccus luteus]|uniref:Uncharacterized protein n=1 Tax=Alkalicoccus luteus TaxID=1237094 RepID=A0A969TV16_9BACI|nr:hypothetical protein [Alkalicoccus luteus]NJP37930.1 hypothetical protein [Alkalicoccus luteus]